MSNETVRIRPEVGSASGRRTGWAKHVTSVDTTKKNGYAFSGPFLSAGVETDLPVGATILHVDPAGSVKNGWQTAQVCRLEASGEETPLLEKQLDWRDDFLSIRDAVEEALGASDESSDPELSGLAKFSDDDILNEARRRGLLD